jgi:hypothetical protein
MEGSGSVHLTNGPGSGRAKNVRIRFRIPNTVYRYRSFFVTIFCPTFFLPEFRPATKLLSNVSLYMCFLL